MPRPKTSAVTTQGPGAFLEVLRDAGRNLKDKYHGKPLELAERLGIMLPRKPTQVMRDMGLWNDELQERWGDEKPGLRELVEETCLLQTESAVGISSRGGGKSKGVSFIEFYLWMILDFDALNLGGSELQAGQVYEYVLGYIESDKDWRTQLRNGETMRERTYKENDAWIRVLTASQKQVRSPHAGGLRKGLKRGGVLVIDEEAECEPDIVAAALPTINTALPSVNIRVSTFHNLGGSFQTVVDNHEEMGYKLFKWDIMDVCAGCGCGGGPTECHSEEVCFREDHYEDYLDNEGKLQQKLIHSAYCGGRNKYGEGWMRYGEIVKLWQRMKRNHSQWEVEAMGSRPAQAGHVVKDQTAFAETFLDEPAHNLYRSGGGIFIQVDWGFTAAGLSVWQEQAIEGKIKQVLLHADLVEQAGQTEIFAKILGYAMKYKRDLVEIACDIGGGGNYNNKKLREEHRMPVRDVNFNEEKEAAVAAFNMISEDGGIVIPTEHADFIRQARNWRRKNERIQKGDDHLCDSAIVCHFSRFIDVLGLTHVRAAPRSFSTSMGGDPNITDREKKLAGHRSDTRRRAMARSFGRNKGR